jgi:hypothetical protein
MEATMEYIKEVSFTAFFYRKPDVKRYTYDIEDNLKELGLFGRSEQTPPLQDDVEPFAPRLIISNSGKEMDTRVTLSQVSLNFSVLFKKDTNINSLEDINSTYLQIRDIIISLINDIDILFENIVYIHHNLVKELKSLSSKNLKITEDIEDIRQRETSEYDSKYFVTNDVSVVKLYSLKEEDVLLQPIFPKNGNGNFNGWQVSTIKEVSSRLAYNTTETERDMNQEFIEMIHILNNVN